MRLTFLYCPRNASTILLDPETKSNKNSDCGESLGHIKQQQQQR
jgi:hypothetical protein